MPASRFGHHFHDIDADIAGHALQLFEIHDAPFCRSRKKAPRMRGTPHHAIDCIVSQIRVSGYWDTRQR